MLWKRLSVVGAALVVSGALVAWAARDPGEATPAAESRVEPPPAEVRPAAEEVADRLPEARPSPEPEPEPAEPDYRDPVSLRGQQAGGLYFTAQFLRRHGVEGVIRTVKRGRLDAAVIDLKDAQGRIGHQTDIEILKPQVEGFLGEDASAFVARLKEEGIYTIARVTCFAEPQLPHRHPEHAIQDARPGKRGRPWVSWGTGHTWLDPYDPFNHEMVIALVKEAEALGFDEVQLDYIRFPVDDGTFLAVYPHQTDQPRDELLLGLLRRIDEALGVPLGVDVFGLTAFRDGDPPELGQHLEEWTAHVEVFSPMLYLNSMRAWMRGRPDREFILIHQGIDNMRRRLGDEPVIRPFLQGFRAGADYWTPRFIVRQLQGAKQGGADGFLFWNTASRYEMVQSATAGPARALVPFPVDARAPIRERAWRARR